MTGSKSESCSTGRAVERGNIIGKAPQMSRIKQVSGPFTHQDAARINRPTSRQSRAATMVCRVSKRSP